MTEEGAVEIPAFNLPVSTLLDERTRAVLLQQERLNQATRDGIPPFGRDPAAVQAQRAYFDQHYYPCIIEKLRTRYHVEIRPETIAGVYCELITPAAPARAENTERLLINLHGGAFLVGGRYGGQLESIPIAALGNIAVLSIDYRKGPEHRFPAATEDVVRVYRELLHRYEPQNIAIFGCSAGAVLTAQALVSLRAEQLPLPRAVGMFSASGGFWGAGDSVYLGRKFTDLPLDDLDENPYFTGVDLADPTAFPIHSSSLIAQFPPALLLSATRDFALSSVVHMHSRLIALGVEADLHVWEGLRHAFFYDPDLPQSLEAHHVIVKFFDRQFTSIRSSPASSAS